MRMRGHTADGPRRIPRALHPVAWWVWAIGLAVAVSRTTNPLLLLLALAVLGFVVAQRRTEAPWARAFKYYLVLALIVIAIRVVFRSVFTSGLGPSDHILFTLPRLPTPSWYSGIHLGGPVSLEGTLSATVDGLQLGTMICCIGAANALANPKRALRVLPGALYELGVAVVVSVNIAPQLVESVQRVARARRLRAGGGRRGRRGRRGQRGRRRQRGHRLRVLRSIAIPVLEDALDRSLLLAAAMDSRGYGRRGAQPAGGRRLTAVLMISGMLGLCAGVYGLLDGTAPRLLGLPSVVAGAALCCAGLALGGRRISRTNYRPDPWRAPEWIVSGCGVISAALVCAGAGFHAADLRPTFDPLHFPPLPAGPTVAILLAALAGVVAPPPPLPARSGSRSAASRATPDRTREQVAV
jgi:energy-coupling factor transport system permease protein